MRDPTANPRPTPTAAPRRTEPGLAQTERVPRPIVGGAPVVASTPRAYRPGMASNKDQPDEVPEWQMDPDIVPAPQPEPETIDDGDEEDGRN